MVGFSEYLGVSLDGVFTNALFIGLILGGLIQDIRNSKYFNFERHLRKIGFGWDVLRAVLYLVSYVVAVPVGVFALTIVILFLWLLSFIVG